MIELFCMRFVGTGFGLMIIALGVALIAQVWRLK
jgi:hypothetical protein